MRWLIDGYNVMHAGGCLGAKLGREGFRRARRRFLGDLVEALGSDRAAQTTVIFDARVPPGHFPLQTSYRGVRVVFALGDEDADSRIESMIEGDANPRDLTVVSSDRRIRQAASRRRATPVTAEDFWVWLDDLREEAAIARETLQRESGRPATRDPAAEPSADDAEYWLQVFRDLDTSENREVIAPNSVLLTDAEIAEIQRQVDREA
jgi:predicted RNA-binding protein with PIN domain